MAEADKNDEGRLTRALRAVLKKERDPKARAWLKGLIRGDAAPKAKKGAKR